ncbi:hypothetical protein ACTWP5_25295 [Streptomyces sp. 4N509B]|uniref:hypothetical protein n=1 Tax=Streptomyces sp. 4N509B TaxID=3457413 RepID=UPI003FD5A1C9
MCAGADLRLLRAAIFAAVCAALAAAGHVAAAGPGIALWALAAGWLLVFAVAAPLAGRERRSTAALTAALTAGQFALHTLYCLGQRHSAPTLAAHDDGGGIIAAARRLLCNDHAIPLTEADATRIVTAAGLDPSAHSGHANGGAGTGTGADLGGNGSGSSFGETVTELPGAFLDAAASLGSAPMLLGHLLAALVAGLLLRRGEAALWRLVRLSGRLTVEVSVRVTRIATLLRSLPRALRLARALLDDPAPYATAATARRGAFATTPEPCGPIAPHAVTRRGPPPAGHPHHPRDARGQLILAA